ncbi:TrmH1: RNA methyltransferase, group 1 [Desulfosarcina variabilis str. Montpellier]|uniref:RNA methyltransferase n=1 Tax=Desulfosarcina variabilis TaxID=2300 RepID=UPI003AFB563E
MQNIRIILVEPQGPINVGSVCRSMMNFGVSDLCLVNPCNDYRSLASRRMALKAETILSQASVFPTLSAALADCHLAFGTTRRFGKYREGLLTPEQSAVQALAQPTGSTVAFVFGREDRGLTTRELDLCHAFVTIPTDSNYPSMNLSHAVALFLYELRKKALTADSRINGDRVPAQARDVENMFQHMRRTLLAAEYLDPQNPDHILRAFRRMFGRSGLDDREVRILHGLWSRIDWIDNERRKHADEKKQIDAFKTEKNRKA